MKSFCCLLLFLLFSSCFEDKGRMMVDGKMEPPAPDESENNKTIGGIDSNNDGVRDDIERWINRKFPGEENYNKRMAWKQSSEVLRNLLIESTSEENAVKHVYKWNDADQCVFYVYVLLNQEGTSEMFMIEKKIHSLHINTKERIKRWRFADKSFIGKAAVSRPTTQKYKACEFKILN